MPFIKKNNKTIAIKDSWTTELSTFFYLPFLSTIACYCISQFVYGGKLEILATLPLSTVLSYGHTLSPRKVYYTDAWKNTMSYSNFISMNFKKYLLFGTPLGLLATLSTLFVDGLAKGLCVFFELNVWGLLAGICLSSFILYRNELFAIKKTEPSLYKEKMSFLWKQMLLPTLCLLIITVLVINQLVDFLTA